MRFSFFLLLMALALSGADVAHAQTSAFSRPPNNLGLVAYWSLNDATSTQATDFSGNGNTGSFSGFATPATAASGWTSFGRRGGALQFDGSNDMLIAGDIGATDNIQRMSISVWVKPDVLADWTPFVSKCDCNGGTLNWNFGMSATGLGGNDDVSFFPNGENGSYTTSGVLAPGQWTHVVATFDGTQSQDEDKITFYINGVAVTETIFDPLPTATGNNAIAVALGQHGGTTGDPYFDGALDEVRIYNRVLTASEAAHLYGAASARSGAVRLGASSATLTSGTTLANGLMGHWTFDGGDFGAAVYDRSGNNIHGYVLNVATSSIKTIGKLGQGITLDGVDDTIIIPMSATLRSDDGSVSAWVRVGNVAGDIVGIASSGATDKYWELYLESGEGEIIVYSRPVQTALNASAPNLFNNQWHHVVVTADTSTKIYLDGVSLTVNATEGTDIGSFTNNVDLNTFRIGSYSNSEGSGSFFDGDIDDLRFYTRALTPAEVLQLYKLGQVRIVP